MTAEIEANTTRISDSLVKNDVKQKNTNREDSMLSKGRQELPIVSIVEGFRNKPSFGLRTWNHLILTLDGRDKITKLLQYVCRLLAWWLQQPNITPSSKRFISNQLSAFFVAERYAAMKNSLATSRKAFRLGRSMIEVQKIQSSGILQWIDLYLKRSCFTLYVTDNAKLTKGTNNLLQQLRTILQSLVHPLTIISTTPTQPTTSSSAPLWNVAGNSIKSLGLFIFWAADNMSFLYQSGFLDDYQLNSNDRVNERSRKVAMSTNIANRSYFIGAIAGLVTNWNLYWNYSTQQLMELQNNVVASEANSEVHQDAKNTLQKAQEKQFTLFVALVKSVCDVLVFSNNAGVDLWKKYRGRPLHEGLHCLCGMVSASVVLYNNYPSVSDLE